MTEEIRFIDEEERGRSSLLWALKKYMFVHFQIQKKIWRITDRHESFLIVWKCLYRIDEKDRIHTPVFIHKLCICVCSSEAYFVHLKLRRAPFNPNMILFGAKAVSLPYSDSEILDNFGKFAFRLIFEMNLGFVTMLDDTYFTNSKTDHFR